MRAVLCSLVLWWCLASSPCAGSDVRISDLTLKSRNNEPLAEFGHHDHLLNAEWDAANAADKISEDRSLEWRHLQCWKSQRSASQAAVQSARAVEIRCSATSKAGDKALQDSASQLSHSPEKGVLYPPLSIQQALLRKIGSHDALDDSSLNQIGKFSCHGHEEVAKVSVSEDGETQIVIQVVCQALGNELSYQPHSPARRLLLTSREGRPTSASGRVAMHLLVFGGSGLAMLTVSVMAALKLFTCFSRSATKDDEGDIVKSPMTPKHDVHNDSTNGVSTSDDSIELPVFAPNPFPDTPTFVPDASVFCPNPFPDMPSPAWILPGKLSSATSDVSSKQGKNAGSHASNSPTESQAPKSKMRIFGPPRNKANELVASPAEPHTPQTHDINGAFTPPTNGHLELPVKPDGSEASDIPSIAKGLRINTGQAFPESTDGTVKDTQSGPEDRDSSIGLSPVASTVDLGHDFTATEQHLFQKLSDSSLGESFPTLILNNSAKEFDPIMASCPDFSTHKRLLTASDSLPRGTGLISDTNKVPFPVTRRLLQYLVSGQLEVDSGLLKGHSVMSKEEEEEVKLSQQVFKDIPETWRVDLGDLSLKVHDGYPVSLGNGSEHQVFAGSLGNKQCAIKILERIPGSASEAHQAAFLQELYALRSRYKRSGAYVPMIGYALCPGSILLVTEHMPNGNLAKSLAVSDEYQWYGRGHDAMIHLALALIHLHSQALSHLDLKTSSILIAKDGSVKLADVGVVQNLSKILKLPRTEIDTVMRAPEQMTDGYNSPCADIWAFGVILWQVCTRESPHAYQELRPVHVPQEAPREVAELIKRCCSEMDSRPNAYDLYDFLTQLKED